MTFLKALSFSVFFHNEDNTSLAHNSSLPFSLGSRRGRSTDGILWSFLPDHAWTERIGREKRELCKTLCVTMLADAQCRH